MEKLGLVLVGRAFLSKGLIQLSAYGWDCTPTPLPSSPGGTSMRTFQCPGPYDEPLSIHTSTGASLTVAGSFGSVSCGVSIALLWVLVYAKFCLCPSRLQSVSLSPLKAYN